MTLDLPFFGCFKREPLGVNGTGLL